MNTSLRTEGKLSNGRLLVKRFDNVIPFTTRDGPLVNDNLQTKLTTSQHYKTLCTAVVIVAHFIIYVGVMFARLQRRKWVRVAPPPLRKMKLISVQFSAFCIIPLIKWS